MKKLIFFTLTMFFVSHYVYSQEKIFDINKKPVWEENFNGDGLDTSIWH